jgi:hypothetical protein
MNKWKKIGLAVIVFAVLAVVGLSLYAMTPSYQFKIVSDNGVLGVESVYPVLKYNYTVYAEIKHVAGSVNTVTVQCELTREDLTTITRQQTITLLVGESKVTRFFFSNDDLKGKIPAQYKISIQQ